MVYDILQILISRIKKSALVMCYVWIQEASLSVNQMTSATKGFQQVYKDLEIYLGYEFLITLMNVA